MNARFLHPSAAGNAAAAPRGGVAANNTAESGGAAAGRACCCPARPAVQVLMPSGPARSHSTELLLCGHHYRVSRAALAAAGAVVRELPGTSQDIASWIAIEQDDSLDRVS
jgi:hypothetical protein